MSGETVRKACVVAASIGAVEALKDQGVARWNRPLRELHHHAETNIVSSYWKITVDRPTRLPFTSTISSWLAVAMNGKHKVKRTKEESMKRVVETSCFGPNTVRF
ncbi:Protein of unknown function wound-induced [Cynara cardunculus var. scolymus]|uniref:Wound-responsive family protein n=1 Tax=Cynara cardunculus var. scolymus TaxID=59895 RepID=A0A118K134_CYNCS|nr:Protein of unknown function wound-induced [Cynara cardunculus var. scolymus]